MTAALRKIDVDCLAASISRGPLLLLQSTCFCLGSA